MTYSDVRSSYLRNKLLKDKIDITSSIRQTIEYITSDYNRYLKISKVIKNRGISELNGERNPEFTALSRSPYAQSNIKTVFGRKFETHRNGEGTKRIAEILVASSINRNNSTQCQTKESTSTKSRSTTAPKIVYSKISRNCLKNGSNRARSDSQRMRGRFSFAWRKI